MPATPTSLCLRKVRCPKCTALFKEPPGPIFQCPVCSTLLSAGDAEYGKEVYVTVGHEKHEKIPLGASHELSQSIYFREASPTQVLKEPEVKPLHREIPQSPRRLASLATTSEDALPFQATQARKKSHSPDGSVESSSERFFSDSDSASNNSCISDFDFPASLPENLEHEEMDLYSQLLFGGAKRGDYGSQMLGLSTKTTDHIVGRRELLSLVTDAVNKASDLSKGVDVYEEAEARYRDLDNKGQQEDNAESRHDNVNGMLAEQENTGLSSQAHIHDEEALNKLVSKAVSEPLRTTHSPDQSLPESVTFHSASESAHTSLYYEESLQGTKDSDDGSVHADLVDARRALNLEAVALSEFLPQNKTQENKKLILQEESDGEGLRKIDSTNYLCDGDLQTRHNIDYFRSQESGDAYPHRTLLSEEHTLFNINMSASRLRSYQLMDSRQFPPDPLQLSSEHIGYLSDVSVSHIENSGYHKGHGISVVRRNDQALSSKCTRLPDQRKFGYSGWQEGSRPSQGATHMLDEGSHWFHHSENYLDGQDDRNSHESIPNVHANWHYVPDGLVQSMEDGGSCPCQHLVPSDPQQNQAYTYGAFPCSCSVRVQPHAHMGQLEHPTQRSCTACFFRTNPAGYHQPRECWNCPHHMQIFPHVKSSSGSFQASPLGQQAEQQKNCSTFLGPQTLASRKQRHYPPLPGGGSISYVLCEHCSSILQVPSDVPLDGRICQKLRCGCCGRVSKFGVCNHVNNWRRMDGVHFPSAIVATTRIPSVANDELYSETTLVLPSSHDVFFRQLPNPKDSLAVESSNIGLSYSLSKPVKDQSPDSYLLSSRTTTCASSPAENYFSDGVNEKKNAELVKSRLGSNRSHTTKEDNQPVLLSKHETRRPVNEHLSTVFESKRRLGAPGSPLIELFNQESRKFGPSWSYERDSSLHSKSVTDLPLDHHENEDQKGVDLNSRIYVPSVQHLSRQAKYFAGLLKKSLRDLGRGQQKYSNGEVVVNGISIPDAAVRKAEDKVGVIHPGSYWYDSRAGFWGVIGGPFLGIICPNVEELKFPLSKECSGGTTRIIVNGRELHERDLQKLAARGLPLTPGEEYIIHNNGQVIDQTSGQQITSIGNLFSMVKGKSPKNGMYQPSDHQY